MSPFLHDRIVLRPTKTPLPILMPALASPFASSRQLSSIDDVVADADLVRVPQHDVLSEDHVAAAGAEQARIERLPQREAERARHVLATASCTSSYFRSAPQPGRPTTSAEYFSRADCPVEKS